MNDQPLAIFRDGQLWINDGGAFEPVERWRLVLWREHFLEKAAETKTPNPLSATYAAQLQAALTAFEEYERERKCEVAKA